MIRQDDGFDLHRKTDFAVPRDYRFAFGSLLVLLLVIYGNSFHADWHLDDYANIVDNPNIHMQTLSPHEGVRAMRGRWPEAAGRFSRPLSYLTLALNHFFSGPQVFGYHLVNFGIHFTAALVLYLLFVNILRLPAFRDRYGASACSVALLGACLWAAHPLQVTAVTYIVQRMTSLAALFYLLSMYGYLKARTAATRKKGLLCLTGSLVSAGLAFASKESAVMLPLGIVLLEQILLRHNGAQARLKIGAYLAAALVLIGIVTFLLTDVSVILEGYRDRPFSLGQRLMTEPRVLLYYLSLLAYPATFRLTLLHDFEVSTSLWSPWSTLPAILIVVFLCVLAFRLARQRPLAALALGFYFLNQLPESTFVPLELVFEHRNYLPSTFLFLVAAVGISKVLDYFAYHRKIQMFAVATTIFVLASQGHTVYLRNVVWNDNLSLWRDNVRKSPDLHRPRHNLGKALIAAGLDAEGVSQMKQALDARASARKSQKFKTHHNLGIFYLYQGDYDTALFHLVRTLDFIPVHAPTYNAIARIMMYRNQLDKAERYLQKALRLEPQGVEYLLTRSFLLLRRGAPLEALEVIQGRSDLRDDRRTDFLKGEIARHRNALAGAALHFERYRRANPDQAAPLFALLEIYVLLEDEARQDACVRSLFGLTQGRPLGEILQQYDREMNTVGESRIQSIVVGLRASTQRQLQSLAPGMAGANRFATTP